VSIQLLPSIHSEAPCTYGGMGGIKTIIIIFLNEGAVFTSYAAVAVKRKNSWSSVSSQTQQLLVLLYVIIAIIIMQPTETYKTALVLNA